MSESKKSEKFRPIGPTPIVAVGASAGGLDAFQKFLNHLPDNSGMAFVFIQHLDPNHETLMPELLQRHTKMSIAPVTNRIEIKKNHIYFIAPNSTLTIDGDYLTPEMPKQAHGHRSPIDIFFMSLAEEKQSDAIGVILSGTGSDGSIGIKAIKEAGGLTFAQSLESAKYDSMPRNAVGTGMVDFVMDIEAMSEHLVQYVEHKISSGADSITPSKEAKKILGAICAHLLKNLNHDFTNYKENTLLRRIHRRMQMRRLEKGEDYLKILKNERDEAKALLNDFLIGVTYFFRDSDVFEFIKEKIIPEILKKNEDLVRVWVPGCATGEEAYTLAILFKEVSEDLQINPKIQIFATDLDERSIAAARAAVYTEGIAEHVSPYRLKRFFTRIGNNYEVKKSVRDLCLFSKHDLLRDPPFAKIDLVSCRNLLIYFGAELQRSVMSLFTYSVKNNGYLLLGPTESIKGEKTQFETISKQFNVFRNLNSYYSPRIPFPLKLSSTPSIDSRDTTISNQQQSSSRSLVGFSHQIDHLMLRKYIPPHFIVNKHLEIQFYSNNLEGFIIPVKGVPTNNVIQLIVPSLRLDLRSALTEACTKDKSVVKERVLLKNEKNSYFIDIQIDALEKEEGLEKLFLIIFNKSKAEKKTVDMDSILEDTDNTPLEVEHLYGELRSMKEQLRSTVEELENANEELKSSNQELLSLNEEMQSGNEELQTSHEEMQSVNEELETVNVELSTKVSQLDAANSDLENLFRSTEVATIFLDNNLKIKRYTPKAKEICNFIQSDIHRPITDLAFSFEGYDIERELNEVINLLVTKNHAVRLSKSGSWYKLQMHPYKTINNVIEGAIVTLHDITELKNSESELGFRLAQQTSVAELSFKALSSDMELNQIRKFVVKTLKETFNTDFSKILELDAHKTGLKLVEGLGWNRGISGNAIVGIELESQAGFTLSSKYPVIVSDLFNEKRFSGPKLLTDHEVRSGISVVIKGPSGKAYGVLGVHSKIPDFFNEKDIQYVQSVANTFATALEKHSLISTKLRLAQIVQSSKEIIFSCDLKGNIVTWNPAAEKTYDLKFRQVEGRKAYKTIVRSEEAEFLNGKIKNILQGETAEEIRCEIFNAAGDRIVVSLNMTPIRDHYGRVEGVTFVGRDISSQLNTQQLLLDAKNAADEANELKSRFMGVLSHELRTPLSSILGYTDLILKNKNISVREQKEYLRKVVQNGELLRSLVSDILDVSKIEEGKVDIKKTWFVLKDFIAELMAPLENLAGHKELTLIIKYIGSIPNRIYSDPLRLRQIIENLVSNAIKYTESGFVKIRLKVKNEGDLWALEIEVEDSGCGISEEKIKGLFSPFFRADPGRGAPGIGLGLYLAKNLAHQLGGRLILKKSIEKVGSIFKVHIPIDVLKEDTEISKSIKLKNTILTDTSLKGKKILLAEDSEDLRVLFVAYLEMVGAKVETFENGKLALASIKKKDYDLALVDLFMPVMDGRELVTEIRKLNSDFPVIVLTAHAMSNAKQECLDFGFSDYISKPVSQDTLVKKIIQNLY